MKLTIYTDIFRTSKLVAKATTHLHTSRHCYWKAGWLTHFLYYTTSDYKNAVRMLFFIQFLDFEKKQKISFWYTQIESPSLVGERDGWIEFWYRYIVNSLETIFRSFFAAKDKHNSHIDLDEYNTSHAL